jgi:hypothetical protein
VDRYARTEPLFRFVMSYLNADRAGRDVHLWSPAPASVPSGYHKILGSVNGSKVAPPSWGSILNSRSVGKTIVKLGGSSDRVWLTISVKPVALRVTPSSPCPCHLAA